MPLEIYKLDDFRRGCFLANYPPTLLTTDGVEVAVQSYTAGAHEPKHIHRIATEFTLVVSGSRMKGKSVGGCSNSIRCSVELMFRIGNAFDCVMTSQGDVCPEPDPETYLRACASSCIKSKEAIIVEDAPHGSEAASSSGTTVFPVSSSEDVNYARVRQAVDLAE